MTDTASFARGFFSFLDARGIRSAVLHGWQSAFEGKLSDVDGVVERSAFPSVVALIRDYCRENGWMLVQALRHETTAIYGICASEKDPGITVALDLCSDYQRNRTLFLSAEDLLEGRKPLAWGGWRLTETAELKYRFAKAVAKGKALGTFWQESRSYPDSAKAGLHEWLTAGWDTEGDPFGSESGLECAMGHFRRAMLRRRRTRHLEDWMLLRQRLQHPTGLIISLPREAWEKKGAEWARMLGENYFRKGIATTWSPLRWRDLFRTTAIVVPEPIPRVPDFRWANDLVIANPRDPGEIADFLRARLDRREPSGISH